MTALSTTINNNTITMPIVSVSMYSGRTQTEKDRLAEAITDDVVKILNVERKDVIIVFEETPHGNWMLLEFDSNALHFILCFYFILLLLHLP